MRIAWPIVLAFAAIKLVVHLYASGSYSWFRDELYFLACSRHLDWGYVDHPPLIAVVAWIGDHLGDSLRVFRLPVTVAGALRVLLTGVLTARMGGGRVAQALACSTVLCSSMYLGMDSILTMNTFEHIFWMRDLGNIQVLEMNNGKLPLCSSSVSQCLCGDSPANGDCTCRTEGK